jgi:hypothetical protein
MPDSSTIETTPSATPDGNRPSESILAAAVEAAYILAAVRR